MGPSAKQFVRRHVLKAATYEPVQPYAVVSAELGLPLEKIAKLDANLNPYGPVSAVGRVLGELADVSIYPDPESRVLREALATDTGVPAERLLAGAGSDELIDLIMRLCLDPGDGVINCPPTFGMYAFDASAQAANVIAVPRRPDFSLDVSGIEQAVQEKTPKLLFLASPNNPDGSVVEREDLERILALPVLVVLDEAYIEFAASGGRRQSLIQEVLTRDNLVVLRTFSKWAGLAGLRVGYGAFPESLMPHLWKIKQPYNVSAAASAAAMTSLAHRAELDGRVTQIVAERERLWQALEQSALLSPYPSEANFVLCQVKGGRNARELKAALAKEGILVRYFDKPGLSPCIRISVGKPEQTDALLAVLKGLPEE